MRAVLDRQRTPKGISTDENEDPFADGDDTNDPTYVPENNTPRRPQSCASGSSGSHQTCGTLQQTLTRNWASETTMSCEWSNLELDSFMEKEGIFMMNSFFRKRELRKWTWLSPDGVTKMRLTSSC